MDREYLGRRAISTAAILLHFSGPSHGLLSRFITIRGIWPIVLGPAKINARKPNASSRKLPFDPVVLFCCQPRMSVNPLIEIVITVDYPHAGVIDASNGLVSSKCVQIDSSLLLDRVAIQPPLQVGVVKTIKVIYKSTAGMNFLGAEPIQVRIAERAGLCECIPKGIVEVPGDNELLRVDQCRDVPVSIRMIVGVTRDRTGNIRTRQQPPDPSRPLETAAQIASSGITHRGRVPTVTLLNNEVSVVEITHLPRRHPRVGRPDEFLPNSAPHPPVIDEFRFPTVRHRDTNQLI